MPLILFLRPRPEERGPLARDPGSDPAGIFAAAASADRILRLRADPVFTRWRILGTPTQRQSLFLLLQPGVGPFEVPLDPGEVAWAELSASDLEELLDDPGLSV